MGEPAWAPKLEALADRYEVLGELRGGDDLRSYLARRRADATDVTITVARAPGGRRDENNALTHYAADTQLLTNIGHPGMPRVLEARWLGADNVAVVSERVRGTTLSTLTSGDEPLSFPRIAAILQQVNGVQEWARTHGVVHRGVSLDSIVVEDGSGRVMVSLVPTAIPIEGVPDGCGDARVLGALAFELLTGEPYKGGDPQEEMKDLRPQLARRVRDEVQAMLQCQTAQNAPAPDVHTFIAMIATADEMRVGEEERARLEAELVQAHRLECEKWEAQRKQLEERIAADEQRLREQQSALEAAEADHRERQTAELAALEAQRQAADERTRRAEDQAARAEERARELEARAQELDSRAAELELEYASVMPTIEKPATEPAREPAIEPAKAPTRPKDAARRTPVAPAALPPVSDMDEIDAEQPHRRSWTLPASVVALIALIVLGIALSHRNAAASRATTLKIGRSTVVPTAAPLQGNGAATVADSAAGSVAPARSATDSSSGVVTADGTTLSDSARGGAAPTASPRSATEPAPTPAATHRASPRPAAPASEPAVYGPPAPTPTIMGPPADTMVLVPAPVTPPAVHPADTSHPRRDSVSRDTTPRRDTTISTDTIPARR